MTHRIGAHTVGTGGTAMAARRAGAAGMDALQIFTAPPRFYGEKIGPKPEKTAAFRTALEETGIDAAHVVTHAAYVLNLATPDPDKWERAVAGLSREMERSCALGVGAVCFHPGSATDGDRESAAERVGRAIGRALEAADGPTRLLIENTAGAGNTVGRTPDEVAAMLAHVPAGLRARTGYGLDTCHLFASGYDLASSEAALRAVLDEWEGAVGERPGFLHLNDSQGALGSNRDRHALIGEGEIGAEPFRWLLRDPRARGVPLILETPKEDEGLRDDDPSADPWDVRMMELLRGFSAEAGRDGAG